MSSTQIADAINAGSAARADWEAIADSVAKLTGPNGETVSVDSAIPGLSPECSFNQLGTKLIGVLSLLHELHKVQDAQLFPDSILKDVMAHAAAIKSITGPLKESLQSATSGGALKSLDATNITLVTAQDKQVQLAPPLVQLYPAIQHLLLAVHSARMMAGIGEASGFSIALSEIESARQAQRKAFADLHRAHNQIERMKGQLTSLASAADADKKSATAAKDAVLQTKSDVEGIKGEAEQAIKAVNDTKSVAATLKETIDGYQSTFEKFKEDLSTRNAGFEKGKSELDQLLSRMNEVESDLSRLRDKARDILGEATVSGLSDRFAEEMKDISGRMFWMQLLFFASVVFLAIAAGAILNVFPWLERFEIYRPAPLGMPANASEGAVIVFQLGSIFGKAIFLVPWFILMGFSARRYAELFQLRAQYAYKYTVAASLPGFKIEAQSHAEAITAAAFKELLFNPASRIGGGKSQRTGNAFLDRLIEPAIKRTLEKMESIKEQ